MTFAPGGGHRPESLGASKPNDQALLGRGVRTRSLFLDSVRNCQCTVVYAARSAATTAPPARWSSPATAP